MFLGVQVDGADADDVTTQLLVLESQDSDSLIIMYINSPGDSFTALTAIHDMMQYIKSQIQTVCLGQAASAVAILLAAGSLGKHPALPNARVLIHQPAMEGMQGQASDTQIVVDEIDRIRTWLEDTISKYSGKPVGQVRHDIERDKILTVPQAAEYGLVDQVLEFHKALRFFRHRRGRGLPTFVSAADPRSRCCPSVRMGIPWRSSTAGEYLITISVAQRKTTPRALRYLLASTKAYPIERQNVRHLGGFVVRLTDGAELLKYSLCGKSQKQVCKLTGGSGAYVCDERIKLCNKIIEEELEIQQSSSPATPLPKPREINEFLSTRAIGQDHVRRVLSVTVYNHYKHVRSREVGSAEDMLGTKFNILLLGPTGTGKTHLVRYLTRLLDVSLAVVDAAALIEAGCAGKDMKNILLRLIQEADGDIKRVEKGIIYAGEIDKIGRKVENALVTRGVSSEGVQQALLKIIEGMVTSAPPTGRRKHPYQQFPKTDTSGILFIAAGMFAGIEDIVKARLGRRLAGFGSEPKSISGMGDLYGAISAEGPHKFGMILEFIDRLPILTSIKELTEEDLVRVLTEPSNSFVRQYQHLFELDNMNLELTHEVPLAITARVNERKTGACGLSSIMEQILSGLMLGLPSRDDVAHVAIIRNLVEGMGPARFYPKPSSEGERSA